MASKLTESSDRGIEHEALLLKGSEEGRSGVAMEEGQQGGYAMLRSVSSAVT